MAASFLRPVFRQGRSALVERRGMTTQTSIAMATEACDTDGRDHGMPTRSSRSRGLMEEWNGANWAGARRATSPSVR